MSSSDDEYPELDVSQVETHHDTTEDDHILGAPPASDFSDSEETNNQFNFDSIDSSEDDFDVEGYEAQEEDMFENAEPSVPDYLIRSSEGQDALTAGCEVHTESVIKLYLTTSLIAFPLKIREGFDEEDLDQCIRDTMGMNLETIATILLGTDKMNKLPNRSKTEIAHSLAHENWLSTKNGKFFPVIPESEKEMVEALIDGSERSKTMEEKKKREAENFSSEDAEIRALCTFNLVAELLHVCRERHRIKQVQYQMLSNAFRDMVTGNDHGHIYDKYQTILSLNSSMVWNSIWFNKYTNRSTLKKFVTSSRFSEIVVTQSKTTELYFRSDKDETGGSVRLFTDADIEGVRQKWRRGKTESGEERGNRGRGRPLQKKNTIVQDPNYRPSTLNGGISNFDEDDGSLQPTTSSMIPRTARQLPSSPSRDRSESSDHRRVDEERTSFNDSAPSNSVPQRNPFGGATFSSTFGFQQTRGNSGPERGNRPPAAVPEYGNSTSGESDFTSDGEYSDEDEEKKEETRKRRAEKAEKKKQKEAERREKHKQQAPKVPTRNRFDTTSFRNARRSPSPLASDSQRNIQTSENTNTAAPLPQASSTVPPPTIQPQPSQQQPVNPPPQQTRPPQQMEPPGPPTNVSNPINAPMSVSSNRYDEAAPNSQLPFRPNEEQIAKNLEMEIKQKMEEEREQKRVNDQLQAQKTCVHPGIAAKLSSNVGRQNFQAPTPPNNGFVQTGQSSPQPHTSAQLQQSYQYSSEGQMLQNRDRLSHNQDLHTNQSYRPPPQNFPNAWPSGMESARSNSTYDHREYERRTEQSHQRRHSPQQYPPQHQSHHHIDPWQHRQHDQYHQYQSREAPLPYHPHTATRPRGPLESHSGRSVYSQPRESLSVFGRVNDDTFGRGLSDLISSIVTRFTSQGRIVYRHILQEELRRCGYQDFDDVVNFIRMRMQGRIQIVSSGDSLMFLPS